MIYSCRSQPHLAPVHSQEGQHYINPKPWADMRSMYRSVLGTAGGVLFSSNDLEDRGDDLMAQLGACSLVLWSVIGQVQRFTAWTYVPLQEKKVSGTWVRLVQPSMSLSAPKGSSSFAKDARFPWKVSSLPILGQCLHLAGSCLWPACAAGLFLLC